MLSLRFSRIWSPTRRRRKLLATTLAFLVLGGGTSCDALLGIETYELRVHNTIDGSDAVVGTSGTPNGAAAPSDTTTLESAPSDATSSAADANATHVIGGQPDGSTETAPSPESTDPLDAIQVNITAEPDIPGYPTRLVGTVIHDLPDPPSLQWSIVAAPNGVDVSSLVLSEDYVSNPTFVAIRGGSHTVQLEASWESGQSKVQTHQFTVPTTPIVLMNASGDEGNFSTSPSVIRSDGTRLLTIGDQLMGTATNWGWIERYDEDLTAVTRAYYPLGSEPVLIYPAALMGSSAELRVATPTKNLALADGHFAVVSPQGTRLAFTNQDRNALFVRNMDGSNARVIDSDVEFHPLSPSPPFWFDETRLGWIELASSQAAAELFTVDDVDQPTVRVLMACPQGTDYPFTTSVQVESTAAGLIAIEDSALWRMKQANGGYQCSKDDPLNTALFIPPSGHKVFEFAVSPDRAQLLFVIESADRTSSIWRMNPATGARAELVSADGARNGSPHYIANGRQIVWTRRRPPSGHPESVELWRMNVDGARKTMLYRRESTATRVLLTSSVENRTRCSVAMAARSSHSWTSVLLVAALWFTRRLLGARK